MAKADAELQILNQSGVRNSLLDKETVLETVSQGPTGLAAEVIQALGDNSCPYIKGKEAQIIV